MSRSRKVPRTRRQRRKAAARAGGPAFCPIIGVMHAHGNRSMRRGRMSWRGQQGWRVKKARRGERFGRKLEALIRAGAPFVRVQAERTIMRALLS